MMLRNEIRILHHRSSRDKWHQEDKPHQHQQTRLVLVLLFVGVVLV